MPAPDPQTQSSATVSSASTSPSPSATLSSTTIPPSAKLGPGGVAYLDPESNEMVFYPVGAAQGPIRVSPTLDDTYTEIARNVCPEQTEDSPAAAVIAVHCTKAAGGLSTTNQVLLWTAVDSGGQESTGEVMLEPAEGAKLLQVALIGSRLFASFEVDDEKSPYLRIAVSSSNKVAWKNGATDDSNPIGAASMVADPKGNVLLSQPGRILCVDAQSGRTLWEKKAPSGSGAVVTQSRTHMVLEPYDHGFGNGFALFSKTDGSRITRYGATSIMLDAGKNQAVVSYPVNDAGGANDPRPDPATPALQVMDLADGHNVFTLSKAAGKGLGNVTVVGVFDGHALITVNDGVRAILTASGEADPSVKTFPPDQFRVKNVPVACRSRWVLLGTTNGFGRFESYSSDPDYDGIVSGEVPLKFADIPPAQPDA
ncbi:hypothetical protein [Acidipropionibacterium jensenii]|uniref:hypothetical protein n=1 Tax=Acidipropionibacterium jensenii TaxID=1749 RepID=UPI00214AAFFF|nr:hypothetical protein [Acidipropionibacterium jensenii]